MKKILPFLSVLLALSAQAQDKLLLKADIAGLPNDSTVYLTGFAGDDSDSAYVKDHRFRFDRSLKDGGDVYTIRIGRGSAAGSAITLYLGPGEVNLKGNWPDFNHSVITGNSFVREWKEVQEILHTTAASGGDKGSRQKKLAELGEKWVISHPGSGVSAYVIETFISPVFTGKEILDWIEKLTPAARNNAIVREIDYRMEADIVNRSGHMAPLFTAPDTLGHLVSLSDFKGKYVLVDFWASWCGACRDLNPILRDMYEKCRDRNFTILSVSLDANRGAWLGAVRKDQLPWTQLLDQNDSVVSIYKRYHVVGIPANFLINPDGVIIGVNIGDLPTLESKLTDLKIVNK
jgi:peroxiredoxin